MAIATCLASSVSEIVASPVSAAVTSLPQGTIAGLAIGLGGSLGVELLRRFVLAADKRVDSKLSLNQQIQQQLNFAWTQIEGLNVARRECEERSLKLMRDLTEERQRAAALEVELAKYVTDNRG